MCIRDRFVGLLTAAIVQSSLLGMRDELGKHAQVIRADVRAGDAAGVAHLGQWIHQLYSASPPAVWTFKVPNYTGLEAKIDFADAATQLIVTDASGKVLAWNRSQAPPREVIQHTSLIPNSLRNEVMYAIDNPDTPVRVKTDAEGLSLAVVRIEDDAKTLKGLMVVRASAIDRWSAIVSGVRYYFASNGGGETCINAQLAFPLGILLSYLVARSVTRRFDKVADASARWTEGNFGVRIDDHGQDELGAVAARLNDMAGQMNDLLLERQERAALEERTRIMQDLHDSAKQQALAVSSRLATARVLIDKNPAQTKALLIETEKMHDLLKRELTALITGSPPPLLEDKGIAEAMRDHVRQWSVQTGVQVNVHAESDLALPLDLSHALFRITQEALANVEKHSGASRVDIIFRCCSDPILQLHDNGRGFNPEQPASGFGLFSMRERVRKMGGTLELASAPGQGTTVTVRRWTIESQQGQQIALQSGVASGEQSNEQSDSQSERQTNDGQN